MGPAATFAAGMVAGLVVFLAMAMMGVIAVNAGGDRGMARPAGAAAAGSTAPTAPNRGTFHSLDLDGDGRLSLAEAAGYAEVVTRFDRADRDRDGRLTVAEYERLNEPPPPKKAKRKPAKKSSSRAP